MEKPKLRSNLAALKADLETRRGSEYTIEEIARGADVNRQTVRAWLDNDVSGARFDVIAGLLGYLRAEGLAVGIADLLIESDS